MIKTKICNVGITPSSLAITENSQYAYITNSNSYGISNQDSITVLNIKTGLVTNTIYDSSFKQPYRIAINKKNTKAYITNAATPQTNHDQGIVSILDLKTNKIIGKIIGFDGPTGIVLSDKLHHQDTEKKKKKYAFVTNYGSEGGMKVGQGKTISVVNLKSKKIEKTILVDQAPVGLALSPSESFLYVICYGDGTSSQSGSLLILSTDNFQIIGKIIGLFGPFGIVVSPCGRFVYTTSFGNNSYNLLGSEVNVIDVKTYQIVENIKIGIQPSGIAISSNGKYLYVTTYNVVYALPNDFTQLTYGQSTLNVIELNHRKKSSKLLSVLPVGESAATITISSNEKYLLICNYSQNVIRIISRSLDLDQDI